MDDITEVILQNQKMIYKIAHYFDNGQNMEDLFQVGCIGLMDAYDNYNPAYGTKFTTYAYVYIMGEIKKYIRENKNIKVSKEMIKLSLKIEEAKNFLTQEFMREPTINELSHFLELPEETVIAALINLDSISLDKENEAGNLYDIIPSKAVDYSDLIMLKDEIDSLKEPDRTIIIKRYLKDLTQKEVAEELGINQVSVSRCENKALKFIRSKVA